MNKKFLAAVLLAFITSGVITAAPAKKQIKVTKNIVLEAKEQEDTTKIKKDTIAHLLDNLRVDEAKPLIEELLTVNKNDLDTNIYLNNYLINKNRLNEAQDNIEELLASNQDSSDLHFLQGLIYLKRPNSSDMSYRKNRDYYFENGIEELNKAIELDKNNYRALNALGVAYMTAENFTEAESLFKEAIKLNPQYATAYDNLGTLYYQQGNYDTAANRFNEAAARNPYCYTAHYHLARLSAKNGEYTTALEYLEKSLLIYPSFAYAYNLAGEIYHAQQNEAAAIVNYRKSIELAPEYTTPYLNLAKLYENRADREFALENLKTIAGVDKNTDAICLKIADMELAKRNYEQAEKYYSAISETSDLRLEAIKGLSDTYWMEAQELITKSTTASKDKLYKASAKLESAIKLEPENVELRLAKLKLDKLIGLQSAESEYGIILLNEPTCPAEYIVKGEAYSIENEYVNAKAEFDKAISTAEKFEDLKYMAEYFTFSKNYEMALSAITKAETIKPDDKQISDNKAFVNAKINKSNELLNDAIYFKKEGDKFFSKKYLLQAVEENPANIEANKLLAKHYKKSKNLKAERACYKQILAASSDLKEQKRYQKKVYKLDKKLYNLNNNIPLWQRLFG